jgi:hypothetical protein
MFSEFILIQIKGSATNELREKVYQKFIDDSFTLSSKKLDNLSVRIDRTCLTLFKDDP